MKAKKHNSPKLQSLLDEITPADMERVKKEMEFEDSLRMEGYGKCVMCGDPLASVEMDYCTDCKSAF